MEIVRDYSREYLPAQDIPTDLVRYFRRLTNVIRYQVPYYPPHIFFSQNVALHTQRAVGFWRREFGLSMGERRLWVHDIPEIRIGDSVVVEKANNHKLQKNIDEQEQIAAKQLLKPRDLALLQEINDAGDFWKGATRRNYFPAIGGKLADIIDGNVIFHEIVSHYCIDNGPKKLKRKMNASFHYAFNQGNILRAQLEFVAPKQREQLQRIINLQFAYIYYYWQGVPQNLIPPALQEELAKST